jgi:hypothetical protein
MLCVCVCVFRWLIVRSFLRSALRSLLAMNDIGACVLMNSFIKLLKRCICSTLYRASAMY